MYCLILFSCILSIIVNVKCFTTHTLKSDTINCDFDDCQMSIDSSQQLNRPMLICNSKLVKIIFISCKSPDPIECKFKNFMGYDTFKLRYNQFVKEIIVDGSREKEFNLNINLICNVTSDYITQVECQNFNKHDELNFSIFLNDPEKSYLELNIEPFEDYRTKIPCLTSNPWRRMELFQLVKEEKIRLKSKTKYSPTIGFERKEKEEIFENGIYICESDNFTIKWDSDQRFVDGFNVYPKKNEISNFVNESMKLSCESQLGENISFSFEYSQEYIDWHYIVNHGSFQTISFKYFGKPTSFNINCSTDGNKMFTWMVTFLDKPWLGVDNLRETKCYQEALIGESPPNLSNFFYYCTNSYICNYEKCNGRPACINSDLADFTFSHHKRLPNKTPAFLTQCLEMMNSTSKSCYKDGYESPQDQGHLYCITNDELYSQHIFITGANSGKIYLDLDLEEIPTADLIKFNYFPLKVILNPESDDYFKSITCEAEKYFFMDFIKFEGVFRNGTRKTFYTETMENNKIEGKLFISLLSPEIEEIHCIAPVMNSTETKSIKKSIDIRLPLAPKINTGYSSKNFTIFLINSTKNFLECSTIGHPRPESTIEWFNSSSKISGLEFKFQESFINEYKSSLLEFPIITEEYQDNYTCVAKNEFGEDRMIFTVSIEDPRENEVYNKSGFISDDDQNKDIEDGKPHFINVKLIIIFSVISFVSLTIVVIIIYYFKTRNFFNRIFGRIENEDFEIELYGIDNEDHGSNTNTFTKTQPLPWVNSYKGLKIPKKDLDIDNSKYIGGGNFGNVLSCKYQNMIEVAVKTLKNSANFEEFEMLLEEVKILGCIGAHSNIIGFIGACLEDIDKNKIYLVVELCPMGNLFNYLKYQKTHFKHLFEACTQVSFSSYSSIMDTKDLINWSSQIANAMVYLEDINVIHGDLATRNVLLLARDLVKITDFGLSKKLSYKVKVYQQTKAKSLPLPWMAVESLLFGKFSIESDVWSYGVTLWEIFTLGDLPYGFQSQKSNFEKKIEKGLRLQKPDYANKKIYEKMMECWNKNPETRPKFRVLKEFFNEMLQD